MIYDIWCVYIFLNKVAVRVLPSRRLTRVHRWPRHGLADRWPLPLLVARALLATPRGQGRNSNNNSFNVQYVQIRNGINDKL